MGRNMVRAIVRWLDLGAKLAAAALVNFVVAGQGAQAQIVTTDVAGRQVRLDEPASRIVVGSSSNLDALALAQSIRDSQNAEIAEMQQLLTELGG